ncbi:MAG: hypothetical protein NT117_06250 [Gammaproteobacteria bacterium]|nr:hypothetical protein [Gammaproteobacteria bacterium]
MSIEDRLKVVQMAEIDCEASVIRARDSWGKLGAVFKTAATPWRIVTVGAISGYLMGRSNKPGTSSVGGQIFSTAAQAIITALGASAASGIAAGAAAEAAADASATATSDALRQDAASTDALG